MKTTLSLLLLLCLNSCGITRYEYVLKNGLIELYAHKRNETLIVDIPTLVVVEVQGINYSLEVQEAEMDPLFLKELYAMTYALGDEKIPEEVEIFFKQSGENEYYVIVSEIIIPQKQSVYMCKWNNTNFWIRGEVPKGLTRFLGKKKTFSYSYLPCTFDPTIYCLMYNQ